MNGPLVDDINICNAKVDIQLVFLQSPGNLTNSGYSPDLVSWIYFMV